MQPSSVTAKLANAVMAAASTAVEHRRRFFTFIHKLFASKDLLHNHLSLARKLPYVPRM
jgi:hypothetical protein